MTERDRKETAGLTRHAGAPGTRPRLFRAELANGLEVILAPKRDVPLVTVCTAVRAGACVETPDLDGLCHLHEHMFFKANAAIPDQEAYLQRLEELGASWNGSTSHEAVRYHFTLPSDLLRDGLVFMRDAIQTPLFRQEELEKEREVVLTEYDRAEANPAHHLWKTVERALFGRYFSRKNILGDREVIRTATREKLQHIQDLYYRPDNAALILAGSFEQAEVLAAVEEVFGGWERGDDPDSVAPIPRHPPLLGNVYHCLEQPVTAASLRIGWHGPSVLDQPRDAVVADVLYKVVMQPTSALQRGIVDAALASSASLSYYTLRHVGPLTLSLETRPEKLDAALRTTRRELERLADSSDWEEAAIERARRDLVQEDVFMRQRGRDFAIALGFWWAVGGIEFYESYAERVREVSREDLVAFTQRYLRAPHAVVAMASSEAIREHGIAPATLAAALDSGDRGAGDLQEARRLDGATGPWILARSRGDEEVVALRIVFPDRPSRVGEDRAGVETLHLRSFVDRLRRDHIESLSQLGAHVGSSCEADLSTLGVECLVGSLEPTLELLAGLMSQLDYDEEDLERNRARLLHAHRKSMDNPDSRVGYVVNEVFYPPGHPYRAYPGGTEESLQSLTLEQVLEHGRELFANVEPVFAVAGVDSHEAFAEEVRQLFPTGQPAARSASEVGPFGRTEGSRLRVERSDIPTNYVIAKFSAPSPGDEDFDTFRLAMRVLSRRLWIEVRSRRALSYAVAAGVAARRRTAGYLYVSTQQPDRAMKLMLETVDSMVDEPVSGGDLRAAARTFWTAESLRRESPDGVAAAVARDAVLAGDPWASFTLRERLERIAPADVQEVLGKYVRGLHCGIVGPAENLDEAIFVGR